MKIISVIPARGGSKGIPLKNIVDINGKPLISYTIEASLQSNVDETWVSTDSSEISSVSSTYGASVIDRPSEISTDTSPSEEALLHFARDSDFDIMVFIQPTSPLIKSEDINKGLEMMDKYDSIFTVHREHWLPRWTLDVKPSGWGMDDWPKRPMRQDVSERYVENGAFYITTRKNLLESKLRYSGNIGVLELPLEKSFGIDTYEDLEFIRSLKI
jgi:CMP-N,N'-diacetyllegionaminic acid synthase